MNRYKSQKQTVETETSKDNTIMSQKANRTQTNSQLNNTLVNQKDSSNCNIKIKRRRTSQSGHKSTNSKSQAAMSHIQTRIGHAMKL